MNNLKINMYDPTREYNEHKNDIDNAMSKVLNHGRFINGPEVSELEEQLAKYVNVKYCITVNSGTDAILVSLMAYDVSKDDEIITVAHTWISCSETIALLKAKPVFVDIEDETFNIDPNKIESKITNKTKGILVVNLYGHLANYDAINEIAQKHNLFIIEDGAQSFGASYHNKKSCSFGDIGITSFFPTKPLGCYGDGGACFTNDVNLANKIRAIKNHGGLKRFCHNYIGINSRLDTIQASILLTKLKYLDKDLIKRNNVADYYIKNLQNEKSIKLPVKLPITRKGYYHVWGQFSILTKSKEIRDNILKSMKESGINLSIYYPMPLHHQKCFEYLNYPKGSLPVTEKVCDTIINLPCYAYLTLNEQDYIINEFKKLIN